MVASLKCRQELLCRSFRGIESHQLHASGTPELMDDIYSVYSQQKCKAHNMADLSQCFFAPKNMTAKLPKQPGKQQQLSHLYFMTKTITMPACTMVGRPTVMLLEIYFFFLFFHCLDYPWSGLLASADYLPLLLKNCSKKLKSDTLIFLSLLDTT